MTYFDNNLYDLIILVDILFVISIIVTIINKLIDRSLNVSNYLLKLIDQIKPVDDIFLKNKNFKYANTIKETEETRFFVTKDNTFSYHEVATKSDLTMIFSDPKSKGILIIYISLHRYRIIRYNCTDVDYFVNLLKEFGVNMDVLQQIERSNKYTKKKFKLSDSSASRILVKMRENVIEFRKAISE